MEEITVNTTKQKEVIDLSTTLNKLLSKIKAEIGILHVFVTHTTCALSCADLDPGTDQDLLDALEKMFPKGNYRHPHDPTHVGEHIMSSLLGADLSLPVKNGKLVLGSWQRPILIELSGPRTRHLTLTFSKE